MRSMIKRTTLLLSLLAMALGAIAQPKLTLDSAWIQNGDTVVYFGSSVNVGYQVVVENVGNSLLQGGVKIMMKYSLDTVEYEMARFDTTLEVGQRFQIGFVDTMWNISGNRYKGGDNVLVIWPKAENPNVQSPDTTRLDLYVFDVRNSTPEERLEMQSRLSVYPNPTSDALQLRYLKSANKLEHVRLSTLLGQVVFSAEQPLTEIPVHTLPAGTYLLSVQYRDGVGGTYKINVQH